MTKTGTVRLPDGEELITLDTWDSKGLDAADPRTAALERRREALNRSASAPAREIKAHPLP